MDPDPVLRVSGMTLNPAPKVSRVSPDPAPRADRMIPPSPKGEQDGLGDSSRERIEAQWHLARLYADDDPGKPHRMWEMFLTNSAVWYWTP